MLSNYGGLKFNCQVVIQARKVVFLCGDDMTREELIEMLKNSQLPEFCITDQYIGDLLKKTDEEIHADIADINSFWDEQYAQRRWKTR